MLAATTAKHCSACGNPLEASGQCNVCLLQLGMTQAGDPESDPQRAAMPSLEELNAQFPNLEFTRLVGRGGMGAIYHARQTSLDRDVAVKLIAKEVSSDPAFLERFQREAKTLAKLSHPNIVTIFDYGRTPDGSAYLILEYIDGINLREAISTGSVGSDEALEVVSTICKALEYAHSKGVVHRDIKPENILIGEDGTLKVADFGIAKIIDNSVATPTLTATRQVLGSLNYLAPEQLEAPDQVDHRVDLYALGVIFYEMLTGQLPLGRYEAPSCIHDRLDRRLDAIVLKTLSRKPQQRYQNAAELDSDIVQVAESAQDGQSASVWATHSATPREDDVDKPISVPFTCDVIEGLAEAVGVIGARDNSLFAEFVIRDAMIGRVKSKTHVIEIPKNQLTHVELVRGFLGSKFVVATDRISALGALPNAETGRVQLKIKRQDESTAREITHRLGFDAIQKIPRQSQSGPIRYPNEPTDSQRRLFGVLMIVCGVLNGVGMAVSGLIFNRFLDSNFMVPAYLWVYAVGLLAIVQLINGITNLIGPARQFSIVTAIASMVPLSPIWVISCPASIWFCLQMRSKSTADSFGFLAGSKKVGTTTLMLIRESRWARVVGITGTTAAIVLLGALVALQNGYYPATMRYRIVDSNISRPELEAAVTSRLSHSNGFRGIDDGNQNQREVLALKVWQSHREELDRLLSVPNFPQIVCLQNADASDSGPVGQPSRASRIPMVEGIDAGAIRSIASGPGYSAVAAGETFTLRSDFVARVSVSEANEAPELTIELSPEGRQELAKVATGDGTALGLVIRGLIEGIATPQSISQRKIKFRLSPTSELDHTGIAAGIRGPSIPTGLELLN